VHSLTTSTAGEPELDNLPAAPQLLLKLIDLLLAEQVSFEELEAIISRDSALSAKVLSVANSVAYRQWNETLELRHILVALGTRAIKSLALSSAVHHFFSGFESTLGDALQQIWFEALFAAHGAQRIAELLAYPQPAEARMIGLLHGIGKLVLLNWHKDAYLELLQQPVSAHELELLEREQFGLSNAQLAARIFAHWGLATAHQQAVQYQHSPPAGLFDMPQLTKISNLAVRGCHGRLHPESAEPVDDPLFGLNQSMFDQLLDEARDAAVKEAAAYGIDPGQLGEGHPPGGGREPAQDELARRVHRIALIDGIQPELSAIDDRSQLLAAISRQMTLIFAVPRTLFYLPDQSGSRLLPVNLSAVGSRLAEHSIELAGSQSLVAASLARREVLTLAREQMAEHPSVLDRELLLALGTDTLLVLPLLADGAAPGAAVLGCPRGQFPGLSTQPELLLYFGQACAAALRQLDSREEAAQQQLALRQAAQDLAGRTLVHEVSSPLNVISNYLEILADRRSGRGDNDDEITLIQREIQRIGVLLTQFRQGDSEADSAAAVDLNTLLRQLLALLEPTVLRARQLTVELALDENVPRLRSDASALRQILNNLLGNACEALPPGGLIRIRTRSMALVDQTAYCELVVADNGPGVPQEMIPQLFSPVHTGKGGQHQGLGLTITYQLVKRLRGSISYRPAEGGGAEFAVLIPVEQDP